MPIFIICCFVIVGFVVGWYVVAKLKQNKDSVVVSAKLDKDIPQIDVEDISLGYFGVFKKEKVKIKDLQEDCKKSENPEDNQKLLQQSFLELKNLIEDNSQYIINYYMSRPFDIGLDEEWDNWIFTKEQKKLPQEELAKLRDKIQIEIMEELNNYLDKGTTKDIKVLYGKYLPNFDYEQFVQTIELEYLTMSADGFTMQLSDKNMQFFCSAYDNFDKDLNDFDWHNF